MKCSVLLLLLGSLYAFLLWLVWLQLHLCQVCTTWCVTEAMPIHFINSKCHNYKETVGKAVNLFNQSHGVCITPYHTMPLQVDTQFHGGCIFLIHTLKFSLLCASFLNKLRCFKVEIFLAVEKSGFLGMQIILSCFTFLHCIVCNAHLPFSENVLIGWFTLLYSYII